MSFLHARNTFIQMIFNSFQELVMASEARQSCYEGSSVQSFQVYLEHSGEHQSVLKCVHEVLPGEFKRYKSFILQHCLFTINLLRSSGYLLCWFMYSFYLEDQIYIMDHWLHESCENLHNILCEISIRQKQSKWHSVENPENNVFILKWCMINKQYWNCLY